MTKPLKAKISITDENGQVYEGEIELTKAGDTKRTKIGLTYTGSTWYKKGSTIEKVIGLINEKFFDKNRILNDIVEQLKTKDFHLKPSDLTLPLRKIVRKGLLKRTKDLPDGTKSKQWTYIKS